MRLCHVQSTEYSAPQRGQCILFAVVFTPSSPTSNHGSVWVLPFISLLLTDIVSRVRSWACPSIWLERFRGTQKELVFNPLWCTPSVAHQHIHCNFNTLPPPPSTVGQLLTHSPISDSFGNFLSHWPLPYSMTKRGNWQNNMSKDDIVTWGLFYRCYSILR